MFKSTKIDTRCFLTTILKRSYALNLRRLFLLMTIKNISLIISCCLNLYEFIFFDIIIQSLNVFSFDLCADLAEIYLFSIVFSFCTSLTTSFKNKIFKSLYYSCAYNFIFFLYLFSFEIFNLRNFNQKHVR